ncbi:MULTISPECIES: amidohydrolase family protein [unclassified Leeuwenhoekiella]|uniref:amidohydrolase family protein n=1 Tax=unclassified Leeuwenhoekiella TaxID=2615029 RepID=UPI000C697498|nr:MULTISPECIES: amidohydrolase family protein [unclassified Leeuwenhoekiella]MAW94936.1 amidohydrolase [Leeuwenhoekiella sp.]MBA79656.1 amidohydrolase [Leeuwenhoekiella sp.]|tara:strand:+ start:56978 stop:58276 length:1299 start_codon:yes stop_codon:yes gene_type:complete
MKTFKKLYLLFLLLTVSLQAQQTPAPASSGEITLTGGVAHIGNGEVIENSLIFIKDGKITGVYDALTTKRPLRGEIIKIDGQHVYPGFIALDTTLGLVEIAAVRATEDQDEIGEYNPHIEAIIAYNAESKVVESMRPNGVLLAQTVPQGGTISGESSVVQLDAWNWEDAVVKRGDGIHLNWPNSFRRGRWWLGEDPGYSPNKDYASDILEIKDFMKQAQAFEGDTEAVMNLPYAAMQDVLNGNQNLYIHVDSEKEILDVIKFKKDMNLSKVVLVGAYRGYKVADEIAKAQIPVILTRVHSLPGSEDDDYDISFKMVKDLTDAGVTVALGNSGEYWQSRNIPFYAGQTTAHGLSFEEALQLITQNAAIILGVEEQLGTLEAGKDATLFVSTGNALEMKGNNLTKAMISGREISLESHQTELWKRYMEKYQRTE